MLGLSSANVSLQVDDLKVLPNGETRKIALCRPLLDIFGGKFWGNLAMEKGTLGLRPGEATLEDLLREVKAESSP